MKPARKTPVLVSLITLGWLMASTVGAQTPSKWVGSWATAQQIPEPNNALSAADLTDATLRQIVHLSTGGEAIRIRLSNAFGTAPLVLGPVSVALAKSSISSEIDPATARAVTFQGQAVVTIPAGAEFVSDPVALPVAPQSDLAISLYMAAASAQQTGHPGSRATSYYVHGDHTSDIGLTNFKTMDHWETIAAVDVQTQKPANAIIAFGDSITDGHGATTNGNDRWPDVLAQRLTAAGLKAGVLNVGIGGNHILTDGLGPNALARFNRDVLAQANARYVIFFEGVNDLGGLAREAPASAEAHAELVRRMQAGYSELVRATREHGLAAIGATIAPFVGSDYYHPDAATEADRQAINAWIRTPGRFDTVIDFDALLRDPAKPDRLLASYDSGDHLHPGPAGYRAMGEFISLDLFKASPLTSPVKPHKSHPKRRKS